MLIYLWPVFRFNKELKTRLIRGIEDADKKIHQIKKAIH